MTVIKNENTDNNVSEITDDEWQEIYENFESHSVLDAVGNIDRLRGYIGDRDINTPPQIRDDLLKLHTLAMDLINYQNKSKAKELFEMAYDIQSDVFDMMDELEVIQDMLNRLTELYPKSLMD